VSTTITLNLKFVLSCRNAKTKSRFISNSNSVAIPR
jgi:hypothetical protein